MIQIYFFTDCTAWEPKTSVFLCAHIYIPIYENTILNLTNGLHSIVPYAKNPTEYLHSRVSVFSSGLISTT